MLDFSALDDQDMEAVDSDDDPHGFLAKEKKRAINLKAVRPRPTSIGDRKVQVLVLPGRQSNSNIATFQISGLKATLGKEVEFHYLDGCVVWKYREGWDLHDADEMTVALSKGKPFYDWFQHETDDARQRLDLVRQQDPSVNIFYKEPEEAVQKVLDFCKERKAAGSPIDVVVAIFEGAIVASMVAAHCLKNGMEKPWRLGVFFSALPIRDKKYSAFFEESEAKVDWPVVLTFGKLDEYYMYNRYGAARRTRQGQPALVQEEYYAEPVIMEYMGGHALPKGKEGTMIYNRIAEEILWHCGLSSRPPRKLPLPPKPHSSPLLDNIMAVRKLKVVALCGGHSCTETLKFQCSSLRRILGIEHAEWVFLEGSKDWVYEVGEPIISEAELKLAGGRQLKDWYKDKTHSPPGDERLFRDQQFDPAIDTEYFDIPQVLEKLQTKLKDLEPFDVVVAFSQGAIMVQMLLGYMTKSLGMGIMDIPWRVNVFFSGMHIRDHRWAHLVETPFDMPTVLVFGKQDEFYGYSRDGFGTGKVMEHCFEEPLILEHDQGHMFPTQEPYASRIYKRCAEEIWKWCGEQPPSVDIVGQRIS